jgi:hypothetical protein
VGCSNCGVENLAGNQCSCDSASPFQLCNFCGNHKIYGEYCHICGHQVIASNSCLNCNATNQLGNYCKVCGNSTGKLNGNIGASTSSNLQNPDTSDNFDFGVVNCDACGGESERYEIADVQVRFCTLCGSGESFLRF